MEVALQMFQACRLRSRMYWALLFGWECSGQAGGQMAVLSNRKQPSLYLRIVWRFLGAGVQRKLEAARGCLSCSRLMSSFLTIVLVYCSGCLKRWLEDSFPFQRMWSKVSRMQSWMDLGQPRLLLLPFLWALGALYQRFKLLLISTREELVKSSSLLQPSILFLCQGSGSDLSFLQFASQLKEYFLLSLGWEVNSFMGESAKSTWESQFFPSFILLKLPSLSVRAIAGVCFSLSSSLPTSALRCRFLCLQQFSYFILTLMRLLVCSL